MMKSIFTKFIWCFAIAAIVLSISSCGKKDNPTSPTTNTGSDRAIISFKFESTNPVSIGIIDENAKTIKVTVTPGTDVTTLVPTITVSDNATVSPASGVQQDFTLPVKYTVTSGSGVKAIYTVTVVEDSTKPLGLNGSMSLDKDFVLKKRSSVPDYIIDGYYEISGNRLLTIEAGVKIAFNSNSQLVIDDGVGIKIAGTAANPVVFYGNNNSNPGAWKGIIINSNRSDNQWDYVNILNAGPTESDAAVTLYSDAVLSMRNCSIEGSRGYGISMSRGSSFNDFNHNIIKNCGAAPATCESLNQTKKFDNTSSFSNNTLTYIEISSSSSFTSDFTLNKLDVPYLTQSYIEITGGTFTVQPGVALKFESDEWLSVSEGGKIKAEGSASDSITFTGVDKEPGYWKGISINNKLSNSFKNCVIEYAGSNNSQNLDIMNGKVTLANCLIQHSKYYGILISGNTEQTNTGITFFDNPGGNVYNNDDGSKLDNLP